MIVEQGSQLAMGKLKLLYIFNRYDVPLTNNEITGFIVGYDIMDYFSLQNILSTLYETKLIDIYAKDGKESFYLTDEGIEFLNLFGDILPDSFKELISKLFSAIEKDIKRRSELFGHYFQKKDGEFVVSFHMLENNITTFNLSLNVPTKNIAEALCKKWNSNSENMFSEILKTITSDIDID